MVVGSNVSVEEQPSTTPKIETTTEIERIIDHKIMGFEVDGNTEDTRKHYKFASQNSSSY